MSLKEMFKPTHLNKLLIILATMVVLVFVFSAGVLVGHEKGRFSRNWGENYYRNIIGPGGRGRGMMDFGRPEFNAHSGFGQIIKIEGIGSNKTALVLFDEIGEKQLLLRFAKLRIVK